MGQQQLLLLVLSTIVVGISIVVGIGMFQDSAMDAGINGCRNNNIMMISRAQEWFATPIALGGGGGDFTDNGGLTLQNLGFSTTTNVMTDSTANGIFVLGAPAALSITITATTSELDDDENPRIVATTVTMNASGNGTVVTTVN